MQNFIELAQKNGVELVPEGACQFCGAGTQRGIHECVEIFGVGFPLVDYADSGNHFYRFASVDAHTLQHPEIHGRWNNHFHLTRQHLYFSYRILWDYSMSPKLSEFLKAYKVHHPTEFLEPPDPLKRGKMSVLDVLNGSKDEAECKHTIHQWGKAVYEAWERHHATVDEIALGFLKTKEGVRARR